MSGRSTVPHFTPRSGIRSAIRSHWCSSPEILSPLPPRERCRTTNGDGHLDVVVVNNDFLTGTVSVLLGNSDGTFQDYQIFRSGYASAPNSVAVGDFNGDGILDLAVANGYTGTVSVLLPCD